MQRPNQSKRGVISHGRVYRLRTTAVRRRPLDVRRMVNLLIEEAVDAVAEQMRAAGKSEEEIGAFRQLSWVPTKPLHEPRRQSGSRRR